MAQCYETQESCYSNEKENNESIFKQFFTDQNPAYLLNLAATANNALIVAWAAKAYMRLQNQRAAQPHIPNWQLYFHLHHRIPFEG